MGEVYLAEQPMLRRPCALKIVRPEKAGDPCNLARFVREVQAMASLNGPNAVDIFDYGQAEDGTFYYVMEYLSGMNLQEIIERFGPFSPERAVHVLLQVCKALQEAHQIGLIHRDVKPSNIFLCRRGVQCDLAKLVDFGLVYEARCNDPDHGLTHSGVVLGSPLYMSPEQLSGSEGLDARSDLYSLGLVAYVLLTGKHPFKRANVQAVFAAHLNEVPTPPSEHNPNVPPDLEVIVMRCLEKDPQMRYERATALAAALSHTRSANRWTTEQAENWWRAHAAHTLLSVVA
jgi:serine/threonine-protein kinase